MNKKILIVGGGITGCIASIYAKEKGFDVELHEKSSKLGGILKDDLKENFFFSGCQYFNTQSEWFKYLNDLKEEFQYFNAEYGSYTNFNGKIGKYLNYFPGPIFNIDKIEKKKITNHKIKSSLINRIKCYNEFIEDQLRHWLNFNNIPFNDLHYLSSIPLAINRITTFKNKNNLLKKKKQNKFIDELYGLPRNVMNFASYKASIPFKGYTNFFEKLKKYLIKKNISVVTNSIIKLKKKNDKFEVFNLDKKIDFENILWCGSPTPVIARLQNKVLNTRPLLITNFCYKYSGSLKNFYIQNFSYTGIFRITCFNAIDNNHIVVECFKDNMNPQMLLKEILNILKLAKINLIPNNVKYVEKFKKKRYSIINNFDYKEIKKFKKNKPLNFIDGNWESYTRDQKIVNVMKNIDKLV